MRILIAGTLPLCWLLLMGLAEEANAQAYLNSVRPQRARTSYSAPVAPVAAGYSRRPISKPFQHIERRPTVSPYLNLTREDVGSGNYQTLVRPQLEQIEFNRQQQIQLDRLGREFQQFRTESAYPVGGSEEIRETGHATRFMNLSHYYPR